MLSQRDKTISMGLVVRKYALVMNENEQAKQPLN